MSKRTTVKVNIERIETIIKANGWRNSYFAEVIMKKQRGWVSEWKRGKNFPSPEEAARMCILLKTTPDEILLREGETPEETAKCQKGIALVRDLLDQQGAKKALTETSERENNNPVTQEIFEFVRSASVEELAEVVRYIQFLKTKRVAKGVTEGVVTQYMAALLE